MPVPIAARRQVVGQAHPAGKAVGQKKLDLARAGFILVLRPGKGGGKTRTDAMKDIAEALSRFLTRREAGTPFLLTRLWRDWPDVVGPQIAELARPLGHRRTTLIIGVEDSMVMQEMNLYAPALIEQANDYLGMKFFDKVQLELIGEQVPLDMEPEEPPGAPGLAPPRPRRLGGLLESLEPDSPVAKCYRAYVEYFAGRGAECEENNSKEE
jgi:hypothetical protein